MVRVRTCVLLAVATLVLAVLNYRFGSALPSLRGASGGASASASASGGGGVGGGGQNMCRVSRIVHQCWKSTQVDGKFKDNVRSWVLRNPGWEYRFWTDAEMRALVASHYPEHLPMYDGYPHAIMRADAFRAFVLHAHGGVYADLDFEALRPLSTLLAEARAAGHGVLLGQEPLAHAHALYDQPRMVCNAIMASCAGHPFWRVAMAEMRERRVIQHVKTVRATGPKMLTAAADAWEQRPPAAAAAAHGGDGGDGGGDSARLGVVYGDVQVAAAGAFYPLFDDGHVGATNMRAKCAEAAEQAGRGSGAAKKVSARKAKACATLEALGFHNRPMEDYVVDADPVAGSGAGGSIAEAGALEHREARLALGEGGEGSDQWGKGARSRPFAVHHWAHTWLGGYYGGAQFDVREFVASLATAAERCARRAQALCPGLVPGDRRTAACATRAAGGRTPEGCAEVWVATAAKGVHP
jgi:hypothetical protein